MVSPHRIQPNNTNKRTKRTSNTVFKNDSRREPDLKRPQRTQNDLKTKTKKKNKNILKAGSTHENIEINDQYLDEILHNNNP